MGNPNSQPLGRRDESIRIMCPALTCRAVLAVPAAARGKNVRCRNCGTTIRVPDRAPAPRAAGGADTAGNPATPPAV
jgi:uncharacterized paraquat-inducible protein A